MKLTTSQLGLLNLCSRNPGPSIEEMFNYALSYQVNRNTLRSDYISLLNNHLLSPAVYIDWETFLPAYCLLTPNGEDVLISSDIPAQVLRLALLEAHAWGDESSREEVLRVFPKLSEMPKHEVAGLAEAYYHWSQAAEISNQVKDNLGIPEQSLLLAASRGFAQIQDDRSLIKTIKSFFAVLDKKGDYLTAIENLSQFLSWFPNYEDVIFLCAESVLEEPYYFLTGCHIPKITSIDILTKAMQDMVASAIIIGCKYKVGSPGNNPLAGIGNRIEDILGIAFESANKRLYYQAVHLQYMFITLAEAIVQIPEDSSEFESRAGYRQLINISQKSCLVLESLSDVIDLDGKDREHSHKLAIEIIRAVHRSIITPLINLGTSSQIDESAALSFIFSILRQPEDRLRIKLIRLSSALSQLLNNVPKQRAVIQSNVENLFDAQKITQDFDFIKSRLSRLDDIKENTDVLRYILIPDISSKLVQLVEFAEHDHSALGRIATLIKDNDSLLHIIDDSLNAHIDDLKAEVEEWIKNIRVSNVETPEKRNEILRELSEVLNMTSTGKIIASIPLIPGLIKYETAVGVSIDWNKWLEKIKSVFNKS
jgi:tetratricopeptide (TPR) repeat protein